jgi:2,3-bisphosphoglycerate-independent phosphoglycerate mutase
MEGDIAYRCNICKLDRDGLILDEKTNFCSRTLEDVINNELCKNFTGVQVFFRHTVAYRGILVLRGRGISPAVRTQQPKRNERALYPEPALTDPGAEVTARILRRFIIMSERILGEFLKNEEERYAIIPWGGGLKPKLKGFKEMYGIEAAGIAGVPLIKGICRLCGIDFIEVPGATGGTDTDLMAKASAALRALEDHDLTLIHIEAMDELSHDGDAAGKTEMIRKLDLMVGKIIDRVDLERTRIAVLPDHTTSCRLRSHTADPVPVVVAGGGYPRDGVKEYSETACVSGGLGRFRGKDFLQLFFRNKL